MAQVSRATYRGVAVAIMVATVIGMIFGIWTVLHLMYRDGASKYVLVPLGHQLFNWRLDRWLQSPMPTDINRVTTMGAGFGVAMLLNACRLRLGWFPFHPVGYAVSSSLMMMVLWVPMFIAWAIKLLVLRYGGLKLYRQVLPFFLGVILGEVVVGGLWTIVGIVFNIPYYSFW